MRHSGPSGWVEVVAGCMFSGRSDELRRRVRHAAAAKLPVALFAPGARPGQRPPDAVRLRDGTAVAIQEVASPLDIVASAPPAPAFVVIDEAQFFGPEIVGVVRTLAGNGLRVLCVALDTDFRGETFGSVGALLAEADEVLKLTALCARCGSIATRTQRLVAGRPAAASCPTIHTTDDAVYEPRCRACHLVPDATG